MVNVLSRAEFKEWVDKTSDIDNYGIISIHTPKGQFHFNDTEVILNSSPNVLNLWFHDIDPDEEIFYGSCYNEELKLTDYVYFDEAMASKILEHFENNKDKKNWIIHCTAGISRSGAVGEILNGLLGHDYKEFKRNNSQIKPNIWVKQVFNKMLYNNDQNSNMDN